MSFKLPEPDLQIAFAKRLACCRQEMLQPALLEAVQAVGVDAIDAELASMVPAASRNVLAARGLRAELVFPVPVLIAHNPRLLAYYRLLFGYSQKSFYTKETGAVSFKCLEESQVLPEKCRLCLDELCQAMAIVGTTLLDNLNLASLSTELLSDLTLLTLGAQFRGSVNNLIGETGTRQVFDAVRHILQNHIVHQADRLLRVANAAGRVITIEFASDPDIVIHERMATGTDRNIIAIEIKGGRDYSNIHNRIGEAEKSHQKARMRGFVECWTIINVDGYDERDLHRGSPSTDRFFALASLTLGVGEEYEDFRSRLVALTGIPDALETVPAHPTSIQPKPNT